MLEQYKNYRSGLGEVDGLFDDILCDLIHDLVLVEDHRLVRFRPRKRVGQVDGTYRELEKWLYVGTCPRCQNRTFFANGEMGVWHCEMCNQGGGVVALQYFVFPEKYQTYSPADGWMKAACDLLRQYLPVLEQTIKA